MERFVRGDVVVVPFPFTDLTQTKRRPALVLTNLQGSDLILCQITSQASRGRSAIALGLDDFRDGSLNRISNVRPDRLFTADQAIVLYRAGGLSDEKIAEILAQVRAIFT
jgi:mRNA interferase MazF